MKKKNGPFSLENLPTGKLIEGFKLCSTYESFLSAESDMLMGIPLSNSLSGTLFTTATGKRI